MHFGDQCVLAAVGVDVEGRKHVLALREGATENAEAAKDLLEHLVEHGVDPARREALFALPSLQQSSLSAFRLSSSVLPSSLVFS